MECLHHGLVNSPLARFCAECGELLSFGKTDPGTFHRELAYLSGAVGHYQEFILVCDSSGRLHALDPKLNELTEPIPVGNVLDDHTPASAGGYVYLAQRRGILALDLIAWLQGERPEPFVLDSAQAASSFSMAAERVSVVTGTGSAKCLLVFNGSIVANRLLLPQISGAFYIFPPALHSGIAIVAQRSFDKALICDLTNDSVTMQPLGGCCLHASATNRGAACVVDLKGTRRVVEVHGDGVSNLIPIVPPDTTWFLAGTSPRLHMFGNGSVITLTNSGMEHVIRQSGNIQPPLIAGDSAVALSLDGIATSILSIGLSDGKVRYPGRMAGDGYRDVACPGNRIVVGNGRSLTSISAEVK